MTQNCPICQGSKRITLPVWRPMTVIATDGPPSLDLDTSRTYDCPECSSVVPDHRLHAVGSAHTISTRALSCHPDARQMCQRSAAGGLVDYLMRHDLVKFSERESFRPGETEIVAQIAVVTPDRITTLEQRVKDAVQPAIKEALERAVNNVLIWNFDNSQKYISRRDAVKMIRREMK